MPVGGPGVQNSAGKAKVKTAQNPGARIRTAVLAVVDLRLQIQWFQVKTTEFGQHHGILVCAQPRNSSNTTANSLPRRYLNFPAASYILCDTNYTNFFVPLFFLECIVLLGLCPLVGGGVVAVSRVCVELWCGGGGWRSVSTLNEDCDV